MGNHLHIRIQRVSFPLSSWYSKTTTTFAIGCAVTCLLAFFVMGMPKVKKALEGILFQKENTSSFESSTYHSISEEDKSDEMRLTSREIIIKKRVIPAIYAIIYACLHVAIMLVMMSMNGYVILAIIFGYTIGFAVFSDPPCKSKTEKSCAGGCDWREWSLSNLFIIRHNISVGQWRAVSIGIITAASSFLGNGYSIQLVYIASYHICCCMPLNLCFGVSLKHNQVHPAAYFIIVIWLWRKQLRY